MKVKFTRKMLSEALERLACEAEDMTAENEVITKAGKLAEIVWQNALGFETAGKDGKVVVTKPQVWAINLIYDRLEGRVGSTSEPGRERPTAAKKMSAITKTRLNKLAEDKKNNG